MIKGMLLFSGGFDSVALLHKLLNLYDFDELIVLHEKSDNLQGEFERNNAKKIFDKFKEEYPSKNLKWEEENINLNWFNNDSKKARDVCLLTHFTTILRHAEVNNIYIGWHESNIKYLDVSKKLHYWLKKTRNEEHQILFMENFFSGSDEYQVKANTIKYLLDENLFEYPYTSNLFESEEEFSKRKHWYNNNSKEIEVAVALINMGVFSSKDLSKIFSFKTKKEVQEYYNKTVVRERLEVK